MKKGNKVALFAICLTIVLLLMSSCTPFYERMLDRERQSRTEGSIATPETESTSETVADTETETEIVSESESTEEALPEKGNGIEDLSGASAHAMRSVALAVAVFSPETENEHAYYASATAVLYAIDSEGGAFFVTNYHLVYDKYASQGGKAVSSEIYLYLYGKTLEEYAMEASFVGGSPFYDLAVLYVKNSEVLTEALKNGTATPVTLADSDKVFPGDTSLAIGCPSANDIGGFSVTRGIVSVESEYIDMAAIDSGATVTMRVIRTDTAVNSGNSGGGLFNGRGELIGIVNAKSIITDIDGVGYAIPSNVVRAIADNIVDYCHNTDCVTVMRCILGVTVTVNAQKTVYDEESGRLLYYEDICVAAVNKGTLADGLFLEGDVVEQITVGNRETVNVSRQHHLIDEMLYARIGDSVRFVVRRGDQRVAFTVKITEDCLTAY